jgi:hypothetical protein
LCGESGALLLVRFLARFAAKLMVKIPSASQPKTAAAMVAPCLHNVTTDFHPYHHDELDSSQQISKQDDLARGGGSLAGAHPQLI